MKKKLLYILLIVVTVLIGISLGLWQVKPPRVNKSSPDYPAYQRMMENIRQFAVEPHAAGTEEIKTVRAQIISEIKDIGLSPIIEEKIYSKSELLTNIYNVMGVTSGDELWEQYGELLVEQYNIHSIDAYLDYVLTEIIKIREDGTLPVQNILVKLDSPNSGKSVMLLSHYDSAPKAPGAADDMVGVCAMLEAMRKQAQNENLESDMYFLFTDGEEVQLLGASAFVEANPEMKEKIDLVINFEARGNRGGLLLFETSPKAYSLLNAVKKSGAKPIGMSWLAAVYAMMPNGTDLSVFLDEGYNGINFAICEGVENYHMPTDSYDNLNGNSAWQYLHTALSLADYAAGNPTDKLNQSAQEAVFFPFIPGVMVLMTAVTSNILCTAVCIAVLILLIMQIKRKRLKVFPTIGIGLLFVLSIITAIFFTAGGYLFYIPLFTAAVTGFLKDKKTAFIISKVLSGIIALMLWVPTLFLLWTLLVQPMML